MVVRLSGIFNNNDLLIRKISFPLMTLVMVQYLLVLVSALHSYGIKTSVFVFDSHSRERNGHHISKSQSVLLKFRSVKVLNLSIIKYFEKNSANAISSQ